MKPLAEELEPTAKGIEPPEGKPAVSGSLEPHAERSTPAQASAEQKGIARLVIVGKGPYRDGNRMSRNTDTNKWASRHNRADTARAHTAPRCRCQGTGKLGRPIRESRTAKIECRLGKSRRHSIHRNW